MGMLLASSCSNDAASNESAGEESTELSSEGVSSSLQDSLSYAIGVLITKDLGKPNFDTIYPTEFIQAIDDYFKGSSTMDIAAAGQLLQSASANPNDASQLGQVSYALGTYVANYAVGGQDNEDINQDILMTGIKDALIEKSPKYTQEQAMEVFGRYTTVKNAIMQKKASAEGEKNREIGEKFLAENAKKSGVVVTESGLQYEVLVPGTGAKPAAPTTKVKVHYVGTLINGEVFDSSIERGAPAEFGLNQVIKGWTEGVMLMEQGSKYKFYIPGDLAYGANPRPGGPIGPNETLIFEVELLEILD